MPQPITVSAKPIEKPKLVLPVSDQLFQRKIDWVIITPENVEEQFNKVKESGRSIAMGNSVNFAGSGETDGGLTVNLSFELDNGAEAGGGPFDNHKVSVGSDTLAGTVHIMDRSVERFQVTDATVKTYTVTDTPNGPVSVTVNGNYLIPTNNFNNPQFSVAGNVITIGTTANPVTLNVGDIIEIETNTFRLMQSIQSTAPGASYNFGSVVKNCPTNCSLYVGVPNDSAIKPEAGSVERWANQSRLFGTITGTIANPVLTVGNSIRINNYYVVLTGTTVASLVSDINDANIPNITAIDNAGKLLLTLQNVAAGDEFIKLQVLPGAGTAYADLGIEQMVFAQQITSPIVQAYGHFVTSASISNNALTLVVGAPDSTAIMATTFDAATS